MYKLYFWLVDTEKKNKIVPPDALIAKHIKRKKKRQIVPLKFYKGKYISHHHQNTIDFFFHVSYSGDKVVKPIKSCGFFMV